MSGRRIELSATQVIASMLAAVTGAIAASYTGITGTVVGVAVASVISTAGAAVYKHYLARSQEKLRSAAVVIAPRVRATGLAAHRGRPSTAGPASRPAQAAADPASAVGRAAGIASMRVTAAGKAAAAGTSGRASGESASTAAQAAGQPGSRALMPDQVATDEFPAIAAGGGREGMPAAGPAAPAGESGGPGKWHGFRRRWLIWVAAAAAIFVVTMGVVTVVEVAAGKPLDALIWGRTSHGTTVSDLTGGQPAARPRTDHTTPAPTPTVTLTVTPTPTSTPSPSPSQSSTPSPSPTTSSPSPSPSSSRSSSPS
jgi:hypothetical protein